MEDMPKEKIVILKSGRSVTIKLPPMSLDFMDYLQQLTVKKVLSNPEMIALLSKDEVQELFILSSEINREYWFEEGKRMMKTLNKHEGENGK